MGQLTAAALSAHRLVQWLQQAGDRLAVPLASCEVLLSPSDEEIARDPAMGSYPRARFEQFQAKALQWREACAADSGNVALFYFAGHGLQRTRKDAVLLLEDFADGPGHPLNNSVDMEDLYSGMAPTPEHRNMAMTQLWFVDACRGFPKEFDGFETLQAPGTFGVTRPDADRRCAPLYFGALPGTSAYSIGGETTIMSQALLESLDGAAAERSPGSTEWWVTVRNLLRGLQDVVAEINEATGGTQDIYDAGQTPRSEARIVRLDSAPSVRVKIELRPADAAERVSLEVKRAADGAAMEIPVPLKPNPFVDRWTAGVYTLECSPANAGIPRDPEWLVLPPVTSWAGEAT
jgi:hypothetical protein